MLEDRGGRNGDYYELGVERVVYELLLDLEPKEVLSNLVVKKVQILLLIPITLIDCITKGSSILFHANKIASKNPYGFNLCFSCVIFYARKR